MIDIINKLPDNNKYNIYIFGDSHCKCFYRERVLSIDNIKIYNHYKSSVSMKGLTNNMSKLQYSHTIQNILDGIVVCDNVVDICVLKFGQVDIEYNYYFKLYKKKELVEVDIFYESIITSYIEYVKYLQSKYSNIIFIVCGVNVPNDYNITKYIRQTLRINSPNITYEEQYSNNCKFNQSLYDECMKNEIKYFDLTDETSCDGMVSDVFKGSDNHFSGAEYNKIYNYNTYNVFLNKLCNIINT